MISTENHQSQNGQKTKPDFVFDVCVEISRRNPNFIQIQNGECNYELLDEGTIASIRAEIKEKNKLYTDRQGSFNHNDWQLTLVGNSLLAETAFPTSPFEDLVYPSLNQQKRPQGKSAFTPRTQLLLVSVRPPSPVSEQ